MIYSDLNLAFSSDVADNTERKMAGIKLETCESPPTKLVRKKITFSHCIKNEKTVCIPQTIFSTEMMEKV